jgi:hypothetical protein
MNLRTSALLVAACSLANLALVRSAGAPLLVLLPFTGEQLLGGTLATVFAAIGLLLVSPALALMALVVRIVARSHAPFLPPRAWGATCGEFMLGSAVFGARAFLPWMSAARDSMDPLLHPLVAPALLGGVAGLLALRSQHRRS